MAIYSQIRLSRSQGRSYELVDSGMGSRKLNEIRDLARDLSRSVATDFLEVVIEERVGADTLSTKLHVWSRGTGWA